MEERVPGNDELTKQNKTDHLSNIALTSWTSSSSKDVAGVSRPIHQNNKQYTQCITKLTSLLKLRRLLACFYATF
jgi:hypothetical protein